MPTRQEVYQSIDSERTYQNSLPSTRTDGSFHTVGDFVTMLHYYQNQLVQEWTLHAGDDNALEIMRKIGGIAVHCMEKHGAPRRET